MNVLSHQNWDVEASILDWLPLVHLILCLRLPCWGYVLASCLGQVQIELLLDLRYCLPSIDCYGDTMIGSRGIPPLRASLPLLSLVSTEQAAGDAELAFSQSPLYILLPLLLP